MGSFNATCAISNAPIRNKDEVVLFYIANQDRPHFTGDSNSFRGMLMNADCHFQLLGYPMEGSYIDCGQYRIADGLAADMNLQILKDHYTATPIEKATQYSNPEYFDVDPQSLNHDLVQEMIREGCMYLDSNEDLTRRRFASIMAIHKSVFNEMIDNHTNVRVYPSDPDDFTDKKFFTYRAYYKHMIAEHEKTAAKEKETFDEHYQNLNKLIGTVDTSTNTVFTAEHAYNAAKAISKVASMNEDRSPYSYANVNSWWNIKKIYERLTGKDEGDSYKELYELKCKTTSYFTACQKLYKPFQPSITGSQNDNMRPNAVHSINAGLALLEKDSKNQDEDYDVPFTVIAPMIETKLSSLEKYYENHWQDSFRERGLKAVQYVKRFKPVVELTPENIEQLHLEVLMEAVQCNGITLKIVIDL